jgi:hypothetical protein
MNECFKPAIISIFEDLQRYPSSGELGSAPVQQGVSEKGNEEKSVDVWQLWQRLAVATMAENSAHGH